MQQKLPVNERIAKLRINRVFGKGNQKKLIKLTNACPDGRFNTMMMNVVSQNRYLPFLPEKLVFIFFRKIIVLSYKYTKNIDNNIIIL